MPAVTAGELLEWFHPFILGMLIFGGAGFRG